MRTAVIRECFVIFLQFLNLSINNFDFDYIYDFFYFQLFPTFNVKSYNFNELNEISKKLKIKNNE